MLKFLFTLLIAQPILAQKTLPKNIPTLSLQDVLNQAHQKSETILGINKSIKALESEIRARDVLLSPILNTNIYAYKDKRESFTNPIPREGTSGVLGVSLIKPFSTGTTFTLTAGHNLLGRDDVYDEDDTAEWEIKLTQSLWRDAFGRTTDLRYQGEKYELLSRRYGFEFEQRQFLVNVESAYWDLVLAEKEQVLRTGNIERSTSLESWTQQRVKRFAAENNDLLQVQSLIAQRKLDLISVQNNIESARNTLRQYIPDLNFQNQKINAAELSQDRVLVLPTDSIIPLRLDALAAINRAEQSHYEAERAVDSTRPTLDLYASYGANGLERSANAAWDRAATAKYNQQKVGLVFAMNLDGDVRSDLRTASRENAEALKTRAEGLKRASDISWNDLLRSIRQLKEQIKLANDVSQLQSRKLTVERRRYQQGRTTTLQMTTFEVEATESELTLNRLLVALKKAESLVRLYNFDGASL